MMALYCVVYINGVLYRLNTWTGAVWSKPEGTNNWVKVNEDDWELYNE